MEPFHQHIFVCTQGKPEGVASCPDHGSMRVLQALERELDAQGLDHQVQVTACGCLGLCENGPVMIIYPEGIWYRGVREEDVPEIVHSHLRSGEVVSRLVWSDSPVMKAGITESRNRHWAAVQAKDKAGTLPHDLNEMIRSFMPSRAVLTALELDVFTAVASGASAEQVAQRIQADPRATEMLLNVLVSLELLDKKEGRFFNTVAAARFFCEGSRDNARGGLMHTAQLWHRWSSLTECVRAGTSVETGSHEESSVSEFIAAMDRNAQERADTVVRATGIQPGITRMLDLGGGSGAYSIAFTRALPGLRSEILDRSDVVPLTQEYIRKAGLADRIATRAGDMLCDPLGEDYDLILASAICHMFSPEENRNLFRRIRRALGPKGRFVVQDFILEPDKTVPRFAALFSLNMLVATRAGSSYSEPEYMRWLRDADFSDVRRVRLPGPVGLMIATGDQASL